MEESIRRGTEVFNFGRCTPGGNTHRFKLQWGGEDVQLPWAQWSPGAVGATPSPERPLFQLATRAWQRLPLGIANRLGPVLARRLP
jgi:serine/alanine adding enzyme